MLLSVIPCRCRSLCCRGGCGETSRHQRRVRVTCLQIARGQFDSNYRFYHAPSPYILSFHNFVAMKAVLGALVSAVVRECVHRSCSLADA
jgi:hypothetical protein